MLGEGGTCEPRPPVPDDNGPPDDPNCSNPVSGATGYKYQHEVDITPADGSPLKLARHYNSAYPESAGFGRAWQHSYERRLVYSSTAVGSTLAAVRDDGRPHQFTLTASGWQGAPKVKHRLTQRTANGLTSWHLLLEDNSVEIYNEVGKLTEITDASGRRLTLSYDSTARRRLSTVLDVAAGRSLSFSYIGDSALINTVTGPDAQSITYEYADGQRLSAVVAPNGTGNPLRREYLYNESAHTGGTSLPDALTGITDENGNRYATYSYDSTGRGVGTRHAGDVDSYTLQYNADGSTTVTDPLGASRTYTFTTVQGVRRQIGQSQPGGAGCAASASATSYDANGNLASRTDFNGQITTYTHDLARNLQTQRTEASGTALARTTHTQWHPTWRLPTRIAEPKRRITYVYNGDTVDGAPVSCAPAAAALPAPANPSATVPAPLLCRQEHQATTDENGSAGFAATPTGLPRLWTYTYNAAGQLSSVDGPRTDLSDLTLYTYHSQASADYAPGDLASITNALGQVIHLDRYDGNGRLLAMRDANGVALTFSWSPRGWLSASSVDGLSTTYEHDATGQLLAVQRPDGSRTQYHHDSAQRLVGTSDASGRATNLSLDNKGNVTQTTWVNPDGSLAQRSRSSFDLLGREQARLESRGASDFSTQFGYDANGNRRLVTDPKGQSTQTEHDALNRPTRVIDALAGLTELAYDARDQLTELLAPNGARTTFSVDGLGNVSQELSSDRGTRQATYDAAGNLLSLTDARGITQTRSYDALNRLTAIGYPDSTENVTYTWDSAAGCTHGIGRLCAVSDAAGSTSYAWDARGNLVSQTRTEAGTTYTTHYGHDSADRPSALITPTGQTLSLQRDGSGLLTGIELSSATQTPTPLLAQVQTDAAGRTVALTTGNGVTQTAVYSEDGRLQSSSEQLPAYAPGDDGDDGGGGNGGDNGSGGGGNSAVNDTDAPTLPEWGAIALGLGLLATTRRRQRRRRQPQRQGALAALRPGPTVVLTALLAGLCTALLLAAAASAALADEALTYDANGNITTRALSTPLTATATAPAHTTTFGYDPLDRLSSEAGPARTQSFTLDANGNRLSDGQGSKTYSPNSNRMATLDGHSVVLDAAGHTLQARGLVFAWNQAGQLKSVSLGPTLLASYFYDHRGLRTRKTTTAAAPQGAGTVIYHHDAQGHLLAETTAAGAPLRTYVWRESANAAANAEADPDAQPTPQVVIDHTASGPDGHPLRLYLQTDHLGSPIAARDHSGRLVWAWHSDAFGASAPDEDPDGDGTPTTIHLRFPGQYFDAESALHYNWHRYYDPTTGRYLSPDPIGIEGGSNLFGYVGGNPLNFTDPFGLVTGDKNFGINDRGFWKWWEQNKGSYGPFDKSHEGFNPKKPFDLPNRDMAKTMQEEYEQCKTRDSGRGGKSKGKPKINEILRGSGRGGGRGGSEE